VLFTYLLALQDKTLQYWHSLQDSTSDSSRLTDRCTMDILMVPVEVIHPSVLDALFSVPFLLAC